MAEMCRVCQGNGEIVADWEKYLHGSEADQEDAVVDCLECDGAGYIEIEPGSAS